MEKIVIKLLNNDIIIIIMKKNYLLLFLYEKFNLSNIITIIKKKYKI